MIEECYQNYPIDSTPKFEVKLWKEGKDSMGRLFNFHHRKNNKDYKKQLCNKSQKLQRKQNDYPKFINDQSQFKMQVSTFAQAQLWRNQLNPTNHKRHQMGAGKQRSHLLAQVQEARLNIQGSQKEKHHQSGKHKKPNTFGEIVSCYRAHTERQPKKKINLDFSINDKRRVENIVEQGLTFKKYREQIEKIKKMEQFTISDIEQDEIKRLYKEKQLFKHKKRKLF